MPYEEASAGLCVQMQGENGSLEWTNITIGEEGYYDFRLGYNSIGGDKTQHIIISGPGGVVFDQKVNFLFTETWQEHSITPLLKPGIYSLKIIKSWGWMRLDYLKVSTQKIVMNSRVDAVRINYYKASHKDLCFDIDLLGNTLKEIRVNQWLVPFYMSRENKAVIPELIMFFFPRGTYCINFKFSQGKDARAIVKVRTKVPYRNHYQAENASYFQGISVTKDATASGSRYLKMGSEGKIEFTVYSKQAGWYELSLGYRAPSSDRAQRIMVNNKEYEPEIGFPISPQWSKIVKRVSLKEGINTITLLKSWGYQDFDYLAISEPRQFQPEISPLKNTLYPIGNKRNIVIKLDSYGNQLQDISCRGKKIAYQTEPVAYNEDACLVTLEQSDLAQLERGSHTLDFNFAIGKSLAFTLDVRDQPPAAGMTIVSLDVGHGAAVLVLFPTGKTMLIDTGTRQECLQTVIPFLDRHDIALDYLWVTHYHNDHMGGKELLFEKFPHLIFQDNDSITADLIDQSFELEGVRFTILHTRIGQEPDQNKASLSFMLQYKDFIYGHGGDIYGQQQDLILQRYADQNKLADLRVHVYHGNHHFHGSVSPAYLRASDHYMFIVSAEEHLYGRGAYTTVVKEEVLAYLKENGKRLLEDLLSFETGHTVLRIEDGETWNYESYRKKTALIPFLMQKN